MTRFVATHESILASSAKVLIVPVSADGVVISQTLSHLMQLYHAEYGVLKQQLQKAGLGIGEILALKVKQQTTGLMPTSTQRAGHLLFMVTHHHHHDLPIATAFCHAWQALIPHLTTLVRYEQVQKVSVYLQNIGDTTLWHKMQGYDMPRLRIHGHFAKEVDLQVLESTH